MPPRRGQRKYFRPSFSFQTPTLGILPRFKADHARSPLATISPRCDTSARGYFGHSHRVCDEIDIEKQQLMGAVTKERESSCSSSGSGSGDEEDRLNTGDNARWRNFTDVEERLRIDKGLFGWLGVYVLTNVGLALLSRSSTYGTPYLSSTLTLVIVLAFLLPFIRSQIPVTRQHIVLCLGFTSLVVIPFLSTSLFRPTPHLPNSNKSVPELHSALLPLGINFLSPLPTLPRNALLSVVAFSVGIVNLSPFLCEASNISVAKTSVLGVAAVLNVVVAWWVLDLVTLSRRTGAAATVWARQVLVAVILIPVAALWTGEVKDVYERTQSLGDLLGPGFIKELATSCLAAISMIAFFGLITEYGPITGTLLAQIKTICLVAIAMINRHSDGNGMQQLSFIGILVAGGGLAGYINAMKDMNLNIYKPYGFLVSGHRTTIVL